MLARSVFIQKVEPDFLFENCIKTKKQQSTNKSKVFNKSIKFDDVGNVAMPNGEFQCLACSEIPLIKLLWYQPIRV
jgi:hypothetical protein